ncbi:O-acetyl-ADP-ribose deacetylase [Striga asiatica]|uniref:O-acetyl-ADP-ribose deacetylase n=1 Tax=Striga asiatica TaxID=4170 RepID=A0A5A7QKQ6_STRAF|nr:O-acetyl-ADP-ribose deacetylase [Striga asiatica]
MPRLDEQIIGSTAAGTHRHTSIDRDQRGGTTIASKYSTISSGGADDHGMVESRMSLSSVSQDSERGHHSVVNPANKVMLGGGGADGDQAASLDTRNTLRGPRSKAADWANIQCGKEPLSLFERNSYRNSLRVAKEHNIQYIAFTAISCRGVLFMVCYLYDEVAAHALAIIKEFAGGFEEVHFVLMSNEIYDVWLRKARALLQEQPDMVNM